MKSITLGVLTTLLTSSNLTLAESTEKITFESLPKVVQVGAKKIISDQLVLSTELNQNDSHISYEIETQMGDITIAPDGSAMEVERKVTFSDLSLEAQQAFKLKFPFYKVNSVEKVVTTYYEVKMIQEEKADSIEVIVYADGKILPKKSEE